jgi:hypothetical protein
MLNAVADTFRKNCAEVERLLTFDKDVLTVVIQQLEGLHNDLKAKSDNERMNGGRVLTMVRNIKDNDSLRSRYETIHSQAVVLLVSHFTSALADMFRTSVSERLENGEPDKVLGEEVKLSFREMRDRGWMLKDSAADILIEKKDIHFQDMQSVARAFRDYLGVTLEKDEVTNDIILGQAARHVIVHAGGKINDRTVRQVSGAVPRSLKPKVKVNEIIRFDTSEVLLLRDQMQVYLDRAIKSISAAP